MHSALISLLQKRIEIIADHSFRDRDTQAHLSALKQISEDIETYHQIHKSAFDSKLRHYLAQCSYQKALDHLQQSSE